VGDKRLQDTTERLVLLPTSIETELTSLLHLEVVEAEEAVPGGAMEAGDCVMVALENEVTIVVTPVLLVQILRIGIL
jgi:hypothetical protein